MQTIPKTEFSSMSAAELAAFRDAIAVKAGSILIGFFVPAWKWNTDLPEKCRNALLADYRKEKE